MTGPVGPLLMIDCASLTYRAYHAIPPAKAADGSEVHAIRGFLDFASRLLSDRVPSRLWVAQKYGIPGDRYIDYALLRGDPSDGLPGVAGIGEKTASRLLARYGSLEGILAATDLSPTIRARLRASADYLVAARRVVAPVTDCPVRGGDGTIPRAPYSEASLLRLAKQYSIESAVTRLLNVLAARAA